MVHARKKHSVVRLGFALTLLSGCAAPSRVPSPSRAKVDAAEGTAKVARWRAWEPKVLPKTQLRFPDLEMTAEVESASAPEVRCNKLDDASILCSASIDLGVDDEGAEHGFSCSVFESRTPLPLGQLFRRALGERTLEEAPVVEVDATPVGPVARIVAPSFGRSDDNVYFGTTKVAIAYGAGRTMACECNGAGGAAAFKRISSSFFASATSGRRAGEPVFRYAFKSRRGDRVLGFSFADVFQDEDGYTEAHEYFNLEVEGNTWHVIDAQKSVERDSKGEVDSMRATRWLDGGEPIVLSAKPAELGKVRVKLEVGSRRDALEFKPEAPLSTEVWEAARLLNVSAGKAKTHRYGFLSLGSDGEPTVAYSTLTRAKKGVVLEEVEEKSTSRKRKASAATPARNEIALDERGFATKQISPDTIYERIFLRGDLPKKAAPTSPKKGAR